MNLENIIISVITSIFAAVVFFISEVFIKKIIKYCKSKYVIGKYQSYIYKDCGELIIEDNHSGIARITYDFFGEYFKIEHKDIDDKYIWIGKMNIINDYGNIIWYYKKYNGIEVDLKHHKFGTKKIINLKIDQSQTLYLIEENFIGANDLIPKVIFIKNK